MSAAAKAVVATRPTTTHMRLVIPAPLPWITAREPGPQIPRRRERVNAIDAADTSAAGGSSAPDQGMRGPATTNCCVVILPLTTEARVGATALAAWPMRTSYVPAAR